MNHPPHEDWMSFLYGEDSPPRHASLEAHRRECAECAARVSAWRKGARALDGWELPVAPRATTRTAWRRAAAAALVLGLGVALGRLVFPTGPNAGELRAALAREFDQKLAEVRGELLTAALASAADGTRRSLADYAGAQEELRSSEREGFVAALREVEARGSTGLALLRKELETVAVNTQDGFIETDQRLGQLAALPQPSQPELR